MMPNRDVRAPRPRATGARAAALLLLGSAPLAGQEAPPSPADVLGHELGERFTDADGVARYADALAAASPMVDVRRYGETPEGRSLLQVVIASPEHRRRLDEILALNAELTDPATSETRAEEIIRGNPAVVYFSYGVHGNESSSSEAALYTAWDLARDASDVTGVLDSLVVVIDPAVNPDGRDRYVQWYRQARGLAPNPHPESREHWEPWPGGRFNHYLFDLNRDWAWVTQPETRARLATWSTWNPQVHVDFHEMNWTSSYFFFPATPPINPLYPEHIIEWGRRFGEANAAAFDARGWPYYTAESFDLFYPGYGDSWPSLLGAIGMTYEQAGHARAGLAVRRPDGVLLTLRDRAQHHRVSGEATLRAAAAGRTALLRDFARFHRQVARGLPDILLVGQGDGGRVEALVALLRDQGIQVLRAGRAFRADARPHEGFGSRRDFPAGTYRVPARQPRGRLAVTLLQPETVLDATFSYDVSAWSLPFAFGVEAHSVDSPPGAEWSEVTDLADWTGGAEAVAWDGTGASLPAPRFGGGPDPAAGTGPGRDAPTATAGEGIGVLLAPGFRAWQRVVRFLAAGGRVVALDEGFTVEGRRWPAGTLFLPRYANPELETLVQRAELAAEATVVRSGFTEEGNDLGTEEAYPISLPRVGVLTGGGVSPTSFGAHWFFLERTLGLPFDAVPVDALDATDLGSYDVLVLPELGGPAERALTAARERLDGWVRAGGTLVAVGSGAEAVAEGLAEVEPREREPDEDDEERRRLALRGREARELERFEQSVPGTILSVRLDPAHPLAFGAGISGDPERLFVLHTGDLVFEPSADFETAGYFPAELSRVSGVISEENLERFSEGSWLAMRRRGAGRVILFADDPLFRHFWYGAFQPYANALLLGPAL